MRKLIFCLFGAAVFINSSAQNVKYPKMKTVTDSISFYIGMDVGASIKNMGVEINPDILGAGVAVSVAAGDDFDREVANNFLREYFTVRLPQQKLAESEAYLESIASRPNLQRTESGLLYEVISYGDMNFRAVEDDDSVEVIYKGWLPDGTVFDEHDEGAVFALNRVIPGWAEGMKLIGKGGTIILYIHPDLGYGSNGRDMIPPSSVLIFEVTLLDAPEVY